MIRKVILLALTLTMVFDTMYAQSDTIYIMKGGNVTDAYDVTTVDSVIFYNPFRSGAEHVTNDTIYFMRSGNIMSKRSTTEIDSVIFCKPDSALIPLPRIGTRSAEPYAEFYNKQTGETFKPTGSSYVRLYQVGTSQYHSAFAVGLYDAGKADTALRKMSESGYNLVRIFCFKGQFGLRPILSIEGLYSTNTAELYQPYVNNLLDFLERATRYKVYVQISIDQTPQNNYYENMVFAGYPDIEGSTHREYMVPYAITAKEIYIDKLMQCIIKRNPALLSTIFAYEIRNEINTRTDAGPFDLTTGLVNTAAGEYDMSSAASRQSCQDDNITLYLNRCVAKIKQNDPEALTTASNFTFNAVGKNGMAGNGLLPISTSDARWPVRLNVLLNTSIDFLDIHGYIPSDWLKGLNSSGWSLVDKTKKPFLAGEFGAHRTAYDNVADAAEALYQYRAAILNSGFQGALLFTWDTTEHTRWTMMENGEVINARLKP